jgi:hypothetical protein
MRSHSKRSQRSQRSRKTSVKKSLSKSLKKALSKSRSQRSRSRSRSSQNSRKQLSRDKCNELLREKIKINLDEFKDGVFKSRQQAIAVSYSQVKKKHPSCSRYFNKKK